MFSETHIELDPRYQDACEQLKVELIDQCMLGASVGMLLGLFADLIWRML